MATPASPSTDTWASYIDDAIQMIVDDHRNDPAWAGRFTPGDVADCLALVMNWPKASAYTTTHAMQSHRKAQKNLPGNKYGPDAYCPRWLVSYSRRLRVWIITAYRSPATGKKIRFTKANATSLTSILVNEIVQTLQSDYMYEIVPTLEEHPHLAKIMQQVLTGTVFPQLDILASLVEMQVTTLSQVLTLAERKQVQADIAACTTMSEVVDAYVQALLAAGVAEDEIMEDA